MGFDERLPRIWLRHSGEAWKSRFFYASPDKRNDTGTNE